MSAYGAAKPRTPRTSYLPTTIWAWPEKPASVVSTADGPVSSTPRWMSLHHIDFTVLRHPQHQGLLELLHAVFSDEVAEGRTYPQEDMRNPVAFTDYFLAADAIVAITGSSSVIGKFATPPLSSDGEPCAAMLGETEISLDEARRGRSWGECVLGFYYVKPNYPGRSSHVRT